MYLWKCFFCYIKFKEQHIQAISQSPLHKAYNAIAIQKNSQYNVFQEMALSSWLKVQQISLHIHPFQADILNTNISVVYSDTVITQSNLFPLSISVLSLSLPIIIQVWFVWTHWPHIIHMAVSYVPSQFPLVEMTIVTFKKIVSYLLENILYL